MWDWIFRLLLTWALANPDALADLMTASAVEITTSGGKYIAQCNHGGKLTTYSWPQTASGQALPYLMVQGMLAKVAWVIAHYSPAEIQAFIDTPATDEAVAIYWPSSAPLN
jgi:hypothetical protein